jgi:hypothetical protein
MLNRDAEGELQEPGTVISPAPQVRLVDHYWQTVASNQVAVVTAAPLMFLSGTTAVKVVNGAATFASLYLHVPPHFDLSVDFVVSLADNVGTVSAETSCRCGDFISVLSCNCRLLYDHETVNGAVSRRHDVGAGARCLR